MARFLQAALSRQRALTVASLIALTVLAWAWLLTGAGAGMAPFVSLAPLPPEPQAMAAMAGMSGWTPTRYALTLAMWWVMMAAMMLPSAAPMILLHHRAAAHAGIASRLAGECFLGGYLAAWGAFSCLATALHVLLDKAALLDSGTMTSASAWLSVALLVAAGGYQLSPLKDRCLRHCRSPAQFLSRHFRPGRAGAFRMGLLHGSYCVGCCWPLMMLLFVGGVMNLAWIALLALAVAAEKLVPFGRAVRLAVGVGLIGWGAACALQLHLLA